MKGIFILSWVHFLNAFDGQYSLPRTPASHSLSVIFTVAIGGIIVSNIIFVSVLFL